MSLQTVREVLGCIIIAIALFLMCFYQWTAEEELEKPTETEAPVATIEPTPIPTPEVTPEVTPEPTPEPTPPVEVVTLYNVPLEPKLQRYIIGLSEDKQIDPAIVLAVIETESRYDVDAMGDAGKAYGLMQIHPRWHGERIERLMANDLLDPYQNVAVGIDYLAELIAYYDGNVEMALIGYNAGIVGAEEGWFSVGRYSSDYSRKVLTSAEKLTEGMMTCVLQ